MAHGDDDGRCRWWHVWLGLIVAGLVMRLLAVVDTSMLFGVAVSSAVTLWLAHLRRR